jgi:exopolyphosphatase/guanosine-5'-triphosphate,3'-diphosphate pyrophosphatase
VSANRNRVAVVDIGSNSTRLLVAEGGEGGLTVLDRRSRVTRLGRGVDLSGQLSDEAIEAVCEAVADYVAIYEEAEVGSVRAIATSAVRDASNGAAFIAELRERFALTAQVLEGEEEARLTFLGATAERSSDGGPTLVIDIGGGSTELVVGAGGRIDFHTSLQVGVLRHTERHIASDPPAASELEALAADVRGPIEAAAGESRERPRAAIAVAGTPTSLAAVEMELEPYDSGRVHGHILSLETIQRLLSRLASSTLEERRAIPGLHPDRAPTIVAGVVILIEAMRAFGVDRVEVSEHDILFGAALGELNPA